MHEGQARQEGQAPRGLHYEEGDQEEEAPRAPLSRAVRTLPRVSTREELERAAAASWPAAVTETRDRWLLRATPGASGRRLNSALPPLRAAASEIETVERWYEERGLAPLVQVTPAQDQAELDAALEQRGWVKEAETAVLAAPSAVVAGPADQVDVVDLPVWIDAWRAMGAARALEPAAATVLERVEAPTLPLVARRDGEVAGVAFGVLQPTASIVFSVAVPETHRRRGVASELMRAWATHAGDRTLFLQTFEDNEPAARLYRGLGFTRSHGYHYRRAPQN